VLVRRPAPPGIRPFLEINALLWLKYTRIPIFLRIGATCKCPIAIFILSLHFLSFQSGAKMARRNASWTWDVTHERELRSADLFGGKAPVGALVGLLERIF